MFTENDVSYKVSQVPKAKDYIFDTLKDESKLRVLTE